MNTIRFRIILPVVVSLFVCVGILHSQVASTETTKNYEIEFEFDPYYSDVALYYSLTRRPIPYLGEQDELTIYKTLLYDSPLPRFLTLEASVYPLPLLGVYIKKNHREFYDSANIGEEANLIQSITSGFEEPYAFSVFLGNVVSFKPKSAGKECQGKGYSGYLFSVGNYHIKDNELIEDKWLEVEWKIKGDRIVPEGKMRWSFRIGGIFHGHPEIKDVLYLSLHRDRIDYEPRKFSIFKNTEFEYRFDIDNENWKIIRHFFLAGKSFPLGKSKKVFKLRLGFLWEGSQKYTGSLKRTKSGEVFQILFRPNIEF